MQKFDIDILKRNINGLLKNKGITQQQLAEALGMSQSNVSKALSEKDKKCFTVEQIFEIADYFGVTIDWLMGFETAQKMATGPRAIAAFIATLLESGTLKSTPVKIDEDVYRVVYNSHGFPDSAHKKQEVTYNALYFPNYWYPNDTAKDEYEMEELIQEMFQCGNENRNSILNSFLEKYLAILPLYRTKQLSEEPYRVVLKDYLEQMDET